MKKLLLTLIVTLAYCGSIFAQHPETAYPDFYDPGYEDQAPLYASIMIDGEPVDTETADWDMLEVAAFVEIDGVEIQRSYGMWLTDEYVIEWGELFPTLNADAVYFTDPGDVVYLKMHNHATGEDYIATYGTIWDDGTEVTIITGEEHWEGFDDPDHPLLLNFTSETNGQTFELTVTGYGEDNAYTNLGYYLIASPVMEQVQPSTQRGFLTDDFDLYYFDQGQDKEWVNYEDQYNGGWKLINGMGYLYASKTTTTLSFTGTPQTEPAVILEWKDWVEFPGLNLVGNPLAEEAYIERAYYRMNPETRDGLILADPDEPIGVMEGIFVVATEEGEMLTFTTHPSEFKTQLILNLRPNTANTVIDRAIVNFEDNQELPKIEILNKNSKIYFQKDNQDLATVNAGGMGEIPFCFKAVKNGSYSLSFNSKEVTFNYLHLIDNMTGADTDLLQTPSYSFKAKTTDSASRFKLVFTQGKNDEENAFANFSRSPLKTMILPILPLHGLEDDQDANTIITMADDGTDNSTTITNNENETTNVILADRTLYKDGEWNTICLPFNVTIDDSPLAGATVMELNEASMDGAHVTLNFVGVEDELEAGKPYIIKWEGDGTDNIMNPVFNGVTIVNSTIEDRTISLANGNVKFIGYYDAFDITSDNDNIYYLTSGSTFKHTATGRTLYACRAYFEFSEAAKARQFILNFGENGGTTTGIVEVEDGTSRMGNSTYDLLGRKVDGIQSTVRSASGSLQDKNGKLRKGLYIKDGKKVIVK